MTDQIDKTTDRWTAEHSQRLRDLAEDSRLAHEEATASGGYETGHGDEVFPGDPVEVTHLTLSVLFIAAADLIDAHIEGRLELGEEGAENSTELVNHALDLAHIS